MALVLDLIRHPIRTFKEIGLKLDTDDYRVRISEEIAELKKTGVSLDLEAVVEHLKENFEQEIAHEDEEEREHYRTAYNAAFSTLGLDKPNERVQNYGKK